MIKKITVLFLVFLSLLLVLSSLQAAELKEYNLEKYLNQALEKSRELEDFKLALLEKEINLKMQKADQEVSPSPLDLRQAELELELAKKELEKQKADLIYLYLNDFFSYYKSENLIAIHQRYLETFQIEFANIQEKYEEGILIKSDILQAEVELNRAEANLKAAVRNHKKIAFKLKDNLDLSND
ncbi:MAG: TolC family protein, partial [Halanaerobium sp. MSAO_Bac5]